MITNKATTETLQLISSSTSALDYSIAYGDLTTSSMIPGSVEGKITTATTTAILAAPAASTQRVVKYISVKNIGGVNNTIEIYKDISATTYKLSATVTLLPGEVLEYSNEGRWYYYAANGVIKTSTLTAAGNNTEVQFNNNGVLGSDSDLTYNATNNDFSLGGVDANLLMTPITNEPTAVAGQEVIYASNLLANKPTLKLKGPLGAATELQNAFYKNYNVIFYPQVAAGLWVGTSGTNNGTAAIVLPTTTNLFTSMRKSSFASVITTLNQDIGTRSEAMFWRGSSAGQGGFFFACRFGFTTWTATNRMFVGLAASGTPLAQDASTLANIIGFGVDTADTAITFIHNDGTGTATKDSITGTTLATNQGYAAYIFCYPNDTTVYYRLDDLLTGTVLINTSITTDLPVNTTLLSAHCKIGNGPTNIVAGNATIGINKIYVETDY